MTETTTSAPSTRLLSLDVFRGATIASMMLVNNPGSWSAIYPPLAHAAWHGWTFTDLIFPFFLWIVGVAMTLSFAKRIERGDHKGKLFGHVVYRAFMIYLIGFFLTGFPKLFPLFDFSVLSDIRLVGVLQRIAFCYLAAGAIVIFTKFRTQLYWLIGLLVTYWLAMKLIPVPGYGAGGLEPKGNLSAYLDSIILGDHVWKSSKPWDPEGTLSTLPAIATALFGVMTGHLLRADKTPAEKTSWLFVGGNLLILAGTVMDWWLPINKNLWTSSYSVFMAGMAMNMFAASYWIIDVKGYKDWAFPFQVFGMNAIAVFTLSGILGRLVGLITMHNAAGAEISLKTFMWENWFVPLGSPMNASLYFAVCWLLMLYGIAYFMFKMKWFLKV